MIFINNQSDLDEVCNILKNQKNLYMDTEFCRRKTYYAVLSIVQISTRTQKIIIDVLANLDLSPLKDLLSDPAILKVFHSPDQDFDIFFNVFKELPKNVFDTQIAASVCGMDEGMGYSKLCKSLLNIDIDKSFQAADWLTRPLPEKLLDYAIRDTEFLIPLHRILSEILTNRKLWDSYNAKSAKLLDVNSYKFSPEKILQKMRLTNKSLEFTNNLLNFISLREECAQTLNIPRNHCASDEDLIKLCIKLPTNVEQLNKLHLQFLPIARNNFKAKLFDLCEGIASLNGVAK